jgi:ParB family chromosome partitioning protein
MLETSASGAKLREIPVDWIDRNPENPRIIFRGDELNQLLQSIRLRGVQVPISVYKEGSRYVLIDGERRWRCCVKLNRKTIPALIQTVGPSHNGFETASHY